MVADAAGGGLVGPTGLGSHRGGHCGVDFIEREIYIQIHRYTDTETGTDSDTGTENHSFTPLGLPVFDSLWHIYK